MTNIFFLLFSISFFPSVLFKYHTVDTIHCLCHSICLSVCLSLTLSYTPRVFFLYFSSPSLTHSLFSVSLSHTHAQSFFQSLSYNAQTQAHKLSFFLSFGLSACLLVCLSVSNLSQICSSKHSNFFSSCIPALLSSAGLTSCGLRLPSASAEFSSSP